MLLPFGAHDADEGHLCPYAWNESQPVSVDKSPRTTDLEGDGCVLQRRNRQRCWGAKYSRCRFAPCHARPDPKDVCCPQALPIGASIRRPVALSAPKDGPCGFQ